MLKTNRSSDLHRQQIKKGSKLSYDSGEHSSHIPNIRLHNEKPLNATFHH